MQLLGWQISWKKKESWESPRISRISFLYIKYIKHTSNAIYLFFIVPCDISKIYALYHVRTVCSKNQWYCRYIWEDTAEIFYSFTANFFLEKWHFVFACIQEDSNIAKKQYWNTENKLKKTEKKKNVGKKINILLGSYNWMDDYKLACALLKRLKTNVSSTIFHWKYSGHWVDKLNYFEVNFYEIMMANDSEIVA